jgi:hypothetical protein
MIDVEYKNVATIACNWPEPFIDKIRFQREKRLRREQSRKQIHTLILVKELVDPKQEFDSTVKNSQIKAYETNYSFSKDGIFHTYSNYGKELKNYMIRPLVPERIQFNEKIR